MFDIAFTPRALDDIDWLHKRERVIVFDGVEDQLTHQPNVETRNKKKLRPNSVAEWEIRIDKFRVFYDVDIETRVVGIKMIGYKEGSRLFVRGEEFNL